MQIRIKKLAGLLSLTIALIVMVILIYLRFSNPSLTETQLVIASWQFIAIMFFTFPGIWLLMQEEK